MNKSSMILGIVLCTQSYGYADEPEKTEPKSNVKDKKTLVRMEDLKRFPDTSEFVDMKPIQSKDTDYDLKDLKKMTEQIVDSSSKDSEHLTTQDFRVLVDSARARGKNITAVAIEKMKQSQRSDLAVAIEVYSHSYWRIHGATVRWPNPGYTFRGCDEGTIAFVFRNGSQDMYLCPLALQFNVKWLAQTMIHEGTHLQGMYDECAATYVEVGAMQWSGEGIAFKNGYWSRCFQ